MRGDRFQEIEVFVQISRSGSFSAAARALGLTPSAVSKLVGRLEKRLGARLFNRSTHSVRLSHEGKVLLERASHVVESMLDIERLTDSFSSSPSGELRIYGLPSFSLAQLAPIIPEFLMLNPNLKLDIQLGLEKIDVIETGVDVVLRLGRPDNSSLVSRKIADSGWVVCASPSYLAVHGTPTKPADLKDHNCLNFSVRTHSIAWQFEGRGEDSCEAVRGNATANQASMLRELAVRGLGVIRVADYVVADDIRSGALVHLLPKFASKAREPLFAIYQRQPETSLRIRTFVDFLCRRFSRSPWRISS